MSNQQTEVKEEVKKELTLAQIEEQLAKFELLKEQSITASKLKLKTDVEALLKENGLTVSDLYNEFELEFEPFLPVPEPVVEVVEVEKSKEPKGPKQNHQKSWVLIKVKDKKFLMINGGTVPDEVKETMKELHGTDIDRNEFFTIYADKDSKKKKIIIKGEEFLKLESEVDGLIQATPKTQ
jgi:hypothetical protein